jgi:hypothetical protein
MTKLQKRRASLVSIQKKKKMKKKMIRIGDWSYSKNLARSLTKSSKPESEMDTLMRERPYLFRF